MPKDIVMLLGKRIISCGLLAVIAGLLAPLPIYADTIAVIGSGDVAGQMGAAVPDGRNLRPWWSPVPRRLDGRTGGGRVHRLPVAGYVLDG